MVPQPPSTLPGDLTAESILSGATEAALLPAAVAATGRQPDFAYNALYRHGLLYRPVFDETTGNRPRWPDGKPFAVCLSHDVDIVSEIGAAQSWRKLRAAWQSEPPQPRAAALLQSALAVRRFAQAAVRFGRADPLWCYERWLDAEAEVGARSTFFFFPERVTRRHFSDCTYAYCDHIQFRRRRCRVADFLRELPRGGWEVGVHASWHAATDGAELRRQKECVAQAAGAEVVSVRHHWLRYDIRVTPRLQAAAGFQYDSTLGFNDNVGFRFGTCRPWRLTDLATQQRLALLEIPLIAQDTALLNPLKGLRLDVAAAQSYLTQLMDAVQRVGGVFTLSFHPDVIHPTKCPGWFDLYRDTLRELKSRHAWFATIGELGRYWQSAHP